MSQRWDKKTYVRVVKRFNALVKGIKALQEAQHTIKDAWGNGVGNMYGGDKSIYLGLMIDLHCPVCSTNTEISPYELRQNTLICPKCQVNLLEFSQRAENAQLRD